jgi:hypothetical protein
MKNKVENQNVVDSSIGQIITVLFLQCKSCNCYFSRLLFGILRRVSGRLAVSAKDRPDKPFKLGKCEICGSKEIYLVEYL